MPHRYFTTQISEDSAQLTGPDAHHLARVMRAKLGESVVLCDGNGMEYNGVITAISSDAVDFSISDARPTAAEPGVDVTLFMGYAKQDKLEDEIRHGTELGISHFVPFFSRYCVVTPKKEDQKNVRYARIAFEAAKQSGRGVIPDVAMPMANFGEVCRSFADYDLVLFFYECGGAPLTQLLAPYADAKPGTDRKPRIALVTGAEGGFSEKEAADAVAAGAKQVGLGPRILRCETAPLAAAAAVMTLTGNLE